MQDEVIKSWFKDEAVQMTPVNVGLLNQTFMVRSTIGRFVLQKLNPIFFPQLNNDIDALTRHLQSKGLPTTRLVPTLEHKLWCNYQGQCWRLLTFVEGLNFSFLQDVKYASMAGQTVGRFHHALVDFEHEYEFTRPLAHDTKAHLERLKRAISEFAHHEFAGQVEDLAQNIFTQAASFCDFSSLPRRHSHGDLKISNLLFGNSVQDHVLVDLDTIGLMPWPIEMGDAFRSWCNPSGENVEHVMFDEKIFEAALRAYAQGAGHHWTNEETDMLIEGIRTIPLELSSRFLRDVLEDCYFGYDPERFLSRSSHNLTRAKGQFGVYCEIEKKKTHIERVIRNTFA